MSTPANPAPAADEETRVRVNTETELYPALAIVEIGTPGPDDGFAIPADLWRRLCAAQAEVDDAETAIMRHIAEHYPEARYVHEWLEDL